MRFFSTASFSGATSLSDFPDRRVRNKKSTFRFSGWCCISKKGCDGWTVAMCGAGSKTQEKAWMFEWYFINSLPSLYTNRGRNEEAVVTQRFRSLEPASSTAYDDVW
jgi:hypothetical protein